MKTIKVEKNLSEDELNQRGVYSWGIWEKEVSQFPWSYNGEELCYILEGEVTVTPDGGEAVTIGAGDFVTFPDGMSCHWNITAPIRKHFNFN